MAQEPNSTIATTGAADTPDPTAQPFTEFGATGLRAFGGYLREEFLKDLQGWKGYRVYREMRDNDPIIGAIFFAIEMLLRGVSFQVEPNDPANPDDIEAADFINSCLSDMEQAWPEFVAEALTFLQYGFAVNEIIYKRRRGKSSDPESNSRFDDGMIGWRKFASRAQETTLHWEFDTAGDAVAQVQLLPTGGPLLRVPLSKCLHFRTIPLKNSPEGRSIIRNAYTSFYMKKRIIEIEAIGIERDLAGLPIAWVPARIMNKDASPDDKAQLEMWKKIARDTARNEQEGLVLPLAYDKDKNKIFEFTLLSTGGRRAFDTTNIIDRYDHRITATVLADFIVLGAQSSRGSYAQSKNKTDMFAAAIIAFLDLIAGEFNRKAIPDLLELNSMVGVVKMTHGEVERRDLADLGQFIFQHPQAGVLTPDQALEEAIRLEAGLPPPQGEQRTNLNEGGEGEGGGDETAPAAPTKTGAQGQGQASDATASDGASRRAA